MAKTTGPTSGGKSLPAAKAANEKTATSKLAGVQKKPAGDGVTAQNPYSKARGK